MKPLSSGLLSFILLFTGGLGSLFDTLYQLIDSGLYQVHTGEQTAKILPPDTDGYLTINLRPGLSQLDQMKTVLSNWLDNPAIESQAGDAIGKFQAEGGINIATDILPWIGPEVALGICHDPEYMTKTGEGPTFVIIVGTFDRAKSDAFLFGKFLPYMAKGGGTPKGPTGKYRGIDILYFPEANRYFAFTNEYIIHSFVQSRLEAVLDLYLYGGFSLADTPGFQAAQANLPAERVAMAYGNVDHMFAGFQAMAAQDPEQQESLPILATIKPFLPSFAGVSAYCANQSIKFDYYIPTPEGMVGYPFPGKNPLTSAKIVPASALAFFSEQDFKSLWEWVKPTIAEHWAEYKAMSKDPEFPASLDAWLSQTNPNMGAWVPQGFNWEEDIISWMKGEISFAMMPSTSSVPELLMMVQVDNTTAVAEHINKVINGINTNFITPRTELPIYMRTDNQTLPWYDVRVQQALALAIDRQKIIKNLGVTVDLRGGQIQQYEYNPEKAKKLLADAGYPNGFPAEVICTESEVDLLSVVKAYWAAIGVNLTIQVKEAPVCASIWYADAWKQMFARPARSNQLKLVPTTITTNITSVNATRISSIDFPPEMSPCYAFIDVGTSHYLVFSLTTSALTRAFDSINYPAYSLAQNGNYKWMLPGEGMSWTSMTSDTTANLTDIWGSSGSDVFAVGYNGTIDYKGYGLDFGPMTSPTTNSLLGVWGSSGSDVFVVGDNGTIIHIDGEGLKSVMASNTTDLLRGVWGSSGSDVFAVGSNGIIRHYDGVDVTFATTLSHIPIVPGTTNVTDGVETFTDNGSGGLIGNAGGTGTINYATGALSVTFKTAPAIGASITADYTYTVTGESVGAAEWSKTFGGASDDRGSSVQPTVDGGYIITGGTNSSGAGLSDVYLVKTDASGNMTWSQTFGGANDDTGYSVQPTADGGYIIAGDTLSFGAGNNDVYLIKTDSSGNLTWQKTFGGAGGDGGVAVVQPTADGGYIISSNTQSFGAGDTDVYLIKTDSSGNMTWSQTFGGANTDNSYSVQPTADGGYIIGGMTYSFGAGSNDVYLIKTNASGNMTWQKTFGGTGTDYGSSVQPTADGGYIVSGFANSFGAGGSDVYLIKTNASGNMTWSQTFGGAGNDYGSFVLATADGGYIITGHTYSFGAGNNDVYLIKTNSSGNMTWQKTFGGTGADQGCSVQPTADGGYIVAGTTASFGAGLSDVYLIKTNAPVSPPEMQWQKTFGGTAGDASYSVQPTADGGYIIAGVTYSFSVGSYDVYLIKTNASGNMTWSQTFGGAGGDLGFSVQPTADGGYIIAGAIDNFGSGTGDVWLIKTNSSGNMTWQKTFGGAIGDEAYSVQPTADGGYIITGLTNATSFGAGTGDAWLIKTNSSGNMTWQKTFGGAVGDAGQSVQPTADGGYIITGYTNYAGAGTYGDAYLIKTDASGNMTWSQTFGGAGGDYGSSVQPTADGGYIIAGQTTSFGAGNNDVYLIKTNSSGNMTWQKTFGGANDDWGRSVQPTADGGYIIGGMTGSFSAGDNDVYLIKTNSSGNMTWSKTFGGANNDEGSSVQLTADGGYIIAGYTLSFGAGGDVYLIKVAAPTAPAVSPVSVKGELVGKSGIWHTMTSPTTANLTGVWGSSNSSVFAVGANGTILNYNGTVWSLKTSPTTNNLWSVWGSSNSSVFAVGQNGTILSYNGSGWSKMTSPTGYFLRDVSGSSGSDVFAVGNNGTVLSYNGTSWSKKLPSPTTANLTGVWRSPGSGVFVVGQNGTIIRGFSKTMMGLGYIDIQQAWPMLLKPPLKAPAPSSVPNPEADLMKQLLPALLGPMHSLGMSYSIFEQGETGTVLLRVQKVDTRLFIDPIKSQHKIGDNFTVDVCVDEVWADNVSKLYSVNLYLAFNPNELEVIDADNTSYGIQIKPYLPAVSYNLTRNSANNTAGTIRYMIALLNPADSFPPATKLAAITFKCKAGGESNIIFLNPTAGNSPVNLKNSDNVTIPAVGWLSHVGQYWLPTIDKAVAMPQTITVLGVFGVGDGPSWTNFVVEAHANQDIGGVGIARVNVNLKALLLQMLPSDYVIPADKQEKWKAWLSYLEKWELWHQGDAKPKPAPQGSVYSRNFNMWE